MEHEKHVQKMSLYVPLALLEHIRKSAEQHRRSFNQEVLWLVEQSLEKQKGEQSGENQEL